MQVTGATAMSTLLAGCMRGGPRDGGPPGGGPDDDGNGGDGGGVDIDPGTDIEFSAQTSHWEGLAPSSIEGAENPTLILQEGEDYTIGWTEGDGGGHNIEIRDENDDVVDDLATEVVSEPDEDQILEITASSEMAQYVCDPHQNTMRGDLQIE
ncbi:plastocyanin/azurin family copper-binding protein [Halorussus salinisoli]|uniref:plastocyanin/azurin family copper-binding protein n=1 Tax=Halorussus salinisoli TaxID=2558242 RepID=UPI002A919908|nr:plastocyanin/azurin family copper-binding protein [Halorussus salinisoli]